MQRFLGARKLKCDMVRGSGHHNKGDAAIGDHKSAGSAGHVRIFPAGAGTCLQNVLAAGEMGCERGFQIIPIIPMLPSTSVDRTAVPMCRYTTPQAGQSPE